MIAVLLLAFSACLPASGANVTVLSTSITSDTPNPDDSITFNMEVEGSSNVSKAYLTYCSISPALCYPPKEMKYIGGGVYSVDAGKFGEGEWKFNITLQLKDQNTTTTADTHFFVKKETPGNGGDHNNTTDDDGNKTVDSGTPYIMYAAIGGVAAAVVVVVAAVIWMKKKKPVGK